MKKTLFSIFATLTIHLCIGQTSLVAGDLVITGFNSLDSQHDQFTFVILVDIDENTVIRFTDKGWLAAGGFRTNTAEGYLDWSAPTGGLICGTEITISGLADGSVGNPFVETTLYGATIGTATETEVGFGFNPSQDQLIAFQGPTDATATTLFAIEFGNNNTGWDADATSPATSAVPAGLVDGTTALDFSGFRAGEYDCSVTIGIPNIQTAVVDFSNWATSVLGYIAGIGGCTYSCCPETIWDGSSWSPIAVPDISTTVTIDADYNTNLHGSFSACNLIINTGNNLTVNDGDFVEIQNNVTVDGELTLESLGNFVQNSDIGLFTDNSAGGVQLTKSKSMFRQFTYTYWSSPVIGETIENTFSGIDASRRFHFEAANFVDNDQEINNTGTYNTGVSDDIDDNGDDWQIASGVIQTGKGYATIARNAAVYPDIQNFTFTGAFNNGEILVPLVDDSGGAYNDWNFIGNPYPGPINISTFLSVNSGILGAVYCWDQGTPENANTSGNEQLNFSSDDYAMHNGVGGVGARAGTGNIPNGFIASTQGFFLEAQSTGPITFNNSMRDVVNDNSQFFRNTGNTESTTIDNKLWINLTSDNGAFSQALIGYVNGATNSNDGALYDAKRILTTGNASVLYTTIENETGKFAIQGKAKNSLNINEVIELGYLTKIEEPTQYKLSIQQIQGSFLENNTVYLIDNLINIEHHLSSADYMFTSDVGEFNNRFQIKFSNNSLSIDNLKLESIQITKLSEDIIKFSVATELEIDTIEIFDLLGRQLYKFDVNDNSKSYRLSGLNDNLSTIKIKLSNGETVVRKVIF